MFSHHADIEFTDSTHLHISASSRIIRVIPTHSINAFLSHTPSSSRNRMTPAASPYRCTSLRHPSAQPTIERLTACFACYFGLDRLWGIKRDNHHVNLFSFDQISICKAEQLSESSIQDSFHIAPKNEPAMRNCGQECEILHISSVKVLNFVQNPCWFSNFRTHFSRSVSAFESMPPHF